MTGICIVLITLFISSAKVFNVKERSVPARYMGRQLHTIALLYILEAVWAAKFFTLECLLSIPEWLE